MQYLHAYLKWETMGISGIPAIPMIITCLLQGILCDTGIPRTFYGGKICSVVIVWRSLFETEITSLKGISLKEISMKETLETKSSYVYTVFQTACIKKKRKRMENVFSFIFLTTYERTVIFPIHFKRNIAYVWRRTL